MTDRIELLKEQLIEDRLDLAMEVLATSAKLKMPLGWHYILDLIWLLKELESLPKGARVLDAGAGWGLMQFLLADRGYEVISADMIVREPRRDLERLYRFETMGTAETIDHEYLDHHRSRRRPLRSLRANASQLLETPLRRLPGLFARRLRLGAHPEAERPPAPSTDRPRINLFRCDLTHMSEVPDNSIDAVVSVSALEHNAPATVKTIVQELLRVAKPSAPLLLTVSACEHGSAFHDESHSYLLDERGLIDVYGLVEPDSDFRDFAVAMANLREPRHLGRWLPITYYNTDRNGMPWGIWDPKYMPVGIRKIAPQQD
ncbi:MAG: methyltransferase domain-containing protein [Deltaproteobacteria bacterium]|nr:methyltransferase domain-containing protein [Deltaproteobacteria bacterium]